MKAGIDFGTSLVKAVWKKDDDYRFASTTDIELEELISELKHDNIKEIYLTGTRYKEAENTFKDFEIRMKEGDPIKNEIELQANGVKKLLEMEGKNISRFLIVSIGTSPRSE